MPFSSALIFRAIITLLLAAHVFYMYCTARGMAETFGFDPVATIIAGMFALAMLLPLVWAVALPEIPEALAEHILPRRRWRLGRCPGCGYDTRQQVAPGDGERWPRCPECGAELREPSPWRVSLRTVRTFVTLNLLAWAIGCAVGETWMLIDERDFERTVEQRLASGNTANWGRARRWPNVNCSLVYRHLDGIHATE